MPQATDIVIKNGSAVDKTFGLATPAGSPGVPGQWFLREGANPSVHARILISSKKLTTGAGQKLSITLSVPSPVTNGEGVVKSAANMVFNIDAAVPDFVPDGVRDDAIAYVGNLLATNLVKQSLKTGFAPA